MLRVNYSAATATIASEDDVGLVVEATSFLGCSILGCDGTRCLLRKGSFATMRRGQKVKAATAYEVTEFVLLPAVVEWRLHVGCGKTGFFTELLGIAAALRTKFKARGVDFVVQGIHCSAIEKAQLFPSEARTIGEVTVAKKNRLDLDPVAKAAKFTIDHGTNCKRPDVARLMVERTYAPGRDTAVYNCGRRAREVWTPTEWSADQFRAAGISRVFVVPEAVDISLFRPDDDAPPVEEKKKRPFTILTIAKWEFRKNLTCLLDAVFGYLLLEDGLDDDVHLKLHAYVPSWEPGEQNLQLVAETRRRLFCPSPARQRCPTVEWTGAAELDRRGMRDLYRSADVFVLPTLGEGWGLPIHEAMAMGLPVVVTNHSGPAALVGDAGILLPSHGDDPETGFAIGPTPPDVARGIRAVMRDPSYARRLGQLARDRVSSLFTPDALADIILTRLDDLVSTESDVFLDRLPLNLGSGYDPRTLQLTPVRSPPTEPSGRNLDFHELRSVRRGGPSGPSAIVASDSSEENNIIISRDRRTPPLESAWDDVFLPSSSTRDEQRRSIR